MDSTNGNTFRAWSLKCLLTAGAGVIVCALIAIVHPALLWHAYLFAFLNCWLVVMGATGLLALGNLTGGWWALIGRPFYMAVMKTMPLMAILFVPIGLGLTHLYPWAQESAASELHFSASKAAYFEPKLFLGRAVGYFAVWLVVAWLLGLVSSWKMAPSRTSGMRRVGALSLVLLVPTTTFAAFDWSMSLEPLWYSSIYGALCTVGGVLAAHCLAILGLTVITSGQPGAPADLSAYSGVTMGHDDDEKKLTDVIGDMGNLTLAFLMLWAYFAFSQFLIMWAGNLPTEIVWYLRRLEGGWQVLAVALVVFHFVVPFMLLLSRDLKQNTKRLMYVALLLLVMYDVNLYWTVVPAFGTIGLWGHVANIAALAALGGVWLAVVCWQAERTVAACREVSRNPQTAE